MYNKAIIRFGFCDIQNNKGLSKGYQPKPNTSTLTFLQITKASSNNCLLLRFFEVWSYYEVASIIDEHIL